MKNQKAIKATYLYHKTYFIGVSKHPVLAFVTKNGEIIYITQRDEFVVKRVNQFGYYLYGFASVGKHKLCKFYVSEKNLRKLFNVTYMDKPIYMTKI